jgi:hypothetical protein
MNKTRLVTYVFQNTNHDGEVTLEGDIVGTCELNKTTLKHKLRGYVHYFPRLDKNLSLSWKPLKYHVDTKKYTKVHDNDPRIPTPSRGVLKVRGDLFGVRSTTFVFWPINSAWKAITNWRIERRTYWWKVIDSAKAQIDRAIEAGDLVVAMTDGNKPGRWSPHPRMQEVVGHGPSRIFINTEHKDFVEVTSTEIGPVTGKSGTTTVLK